MTESALSWKEREEEARKAHILNVSERLFASKGLHDTSVADIAREAEFGVGTIYKYFKDRNTLIASLVENRLKAHFEDIEDSLSGDGSPFERINRLIDAYIRSMHKRQKFFRIYFTHFHPDSQKDCCQVGAGDLLMERRRRIIEKIEDVFKQGIDVGQFVPVDPQYLSAALFGMAISFTFLAEYKFQAEQKWDEEGMQNALKRILFHRVLTSAGEEISRDKEFYNED